MFFVVVFYLYQVWLERENEMVILQEDLFLVLCFDSLWLEIHLLMKEKFLLAFDVISARVVLASLGPPGEDSK